MRAQTTPPVVVDRVHKRFEIPRERVSTLKERAIHPLRRSAVDVLQALHDVSFAVEPGEFFGIVGRNGSGKSTLLKCLAGIYAIDSGSIYVDGRLSTFIELGVGFNPDLPARDNVILNATMLGLSPREASKRFESVVDFAGLSEFTDLKLKNYSSGMMVRLAFSVMIQVDADILLIDEVLAVGDAAFQQKCYDEFERIRSSGTTVLFVTHDMSAVQRFCDRALLLERGRIVALGDPEEVGNRYLELNFSEHAREAERVAAAAEDGAAAVAREGESPGSTPSAAATEAAAGGADADAQRQAGASAEEARETSQQEGARYGDRAAEIVQAWFEDERGEPAEMLQTGRACTFVARVRFNEEIENPLFGINVQNGRRDHLLSASNLWSESRSGTFRAGEEVTFRIRFENVLGPDRYYVTPAVARHGGAWVDRRERMVSVVVSGTRPADALLDLPYEVTIDREAEPRGVLEALR
jgi:ABC-type polysaccharide/polyol phosphate transport system ATPase subunit